MLLYNSGVEPSTSFVVSVISRPIYQLLVKLGCKSTTVAHPLDDTDVTHYTQGDSDVILMQAGFRRHSE